MTKFFINFSKKGISWFSSKNRSLKLSNFWNEKNTIFTHKLYFRKIKKKSVFFIFHWVILYHMWRSVMLKRGGGPNQMKDLTSDQIRMKVNKTNFIQNVRTIAIKSFVFHPSSA